MGEAGVGIFFTQSFTNPAYGPEGLALLKGGVIPKNVVHQMTAEAGGRDLRQLAVMNARGEAAAHTGKDMCLAPAIWSALRSRSRRT